MAYRKKDKNERLLTEVELELMNIVWKLGECTVREVHQALPASRDLAYTSVATIIKILEQKGVLKSRKDDRAHTYIALLPRADYEAKSLQHLKNSLFEGDPSSMVMRLLDESDLSEAELQSIRKFLDERLPK